MMLIKQQKLTWLLMKIAEINLDVNRMAETDSNVNVVEINLNVHNLAGIHTVDKPLVRKVVDYITSIDS